MTRFNSINMHRCLIKETLAQSVPTRYGDGIGDDAVGRVLDRDEFVAEDGGFEASPRVNERIAEAVDVGGERSHVLVDDVRRYFEDSGLTYSIAGLIRVGGASGEQGDCKNPCQPDLRLINHGQFPR